MFMKEKNMKTPLCNFCIKSGILCKKCQKKIESGKLGETDLQTIRLLMKLEQKYPSLQKIKFYNAYEIDDVLAIVVGRGNLASFFGDSKILRKIAEKKGKKVRIIEKKVGNRKFLENLFAPAKITTINKIWLPDGTTETRVILSSRPRKLPLKKKVIKTLAKKVQGITLRIAFEDQIERIF